MREAIGASWIMGIVLTFIALFSGYLAFSINYSKAFRVKDGIIERLEKHNGPNGGNGGKGSIDDINAFLTEIGYNSKGDCKKVFGDTGLDYIGVTDDYVTSNPESGTYNYCIQRVTAYNQNGQLRAAYYKVVVFFSLSIPIIDLSSSFHVSGETINIYYPEDDWMG